MALRDVIYGARGRRVESADRSTVEGFVAAMLSSGNKPGSVARGR